MIVDNAEARDPIPACWDRDEPTSTFRIAGVTDQMLIRHLPQLGPPIQSFCSLCTKNALFVVVDVTNLKVSKYIESVLELLNSPTRSFGLCVNATCYIHEEGCECIQILSEIWWQDTNWEMGYNIKIAVLEGPRRR